MGSFAEAMSEYRMQIEKGVIQQAYKGLMDYMQGLKAYFKDRHPDFAVPGSLYFGYMDMTYFSIMPEALKERNTLFCLDAIQTVGAFPTTVEHVDLLAADDHVQEAIEKYTAVAKSYSTRGEARRAVEYYRKIIEIAPHNLQARRYLVTQLIATGQIVEAVKEQMSLAEVYYHQADLEMTRKAYAEALRLCQQYRLDRSWAVEILNRLADIYMQSLDWRQALQAHEQICSLKPDDEKARYSLVEYAAGRYYLHDVCCDYAARQMPPAFAWCPR